MEKIADRINWILKERKIKKTEMARRLGISDSSVSTMCSGKTNPSGQTVTMICREFGVNEEWLRTGKGSPWAPASPSDLERLAKERGLATQEYILIQKFMELPPEVRSGIVDYVISAAAALTSSGQEEPEHKRQARLLREEADAVERGGGELSASPFTKAE